MKDMQYWIRRGFAFELRFPGEYDLWVNRSTGHTLRRYPDGSEWLKADGEYELVTEANASELTEDTWEVS